MDLSKDDIKLIVRLVSEKLGPNAGIEEIKNLVSEVIERFPSDQSSFSPASEKARQPFLAKKLIVNAFGPNVEGLEDKIQTFIAGKSLRIVDISSISIDNFRSIIVIIDYSGLSGEINNLKFEISKICDTFGFKAIIQDSSYYSS